MGFIFPAINTEAKIKLISLKVGNFKVSDYSPPLLF